MAKFYISSNAGDINLSNLAAKIINVTYSNFGDASDKVIQKLNAGAKALAKNILPDISRLSSIACIDTSYQENDEWPDEDYWTYSYDTVSGKNTITMTIVYTKWDRYDYPEDGSVYIISAADSD